MKIERLTTNVSPARRDMLRTGIGLVLAAGLSMLLASRVLADNSPAVHATPALAAGPFWADQSDPRFHRVDVRADVDGTNVQSGVPLNLTLTVSTIKHGVVTPLPNAYVYIWSANAMGLFSSNVNENTQADSFLRGYQVTDDKGQVQFLTLYPGWYSGRTVHVHAWVCAYPHNDPTKKPSINFITQLFFDDSVTDQIMKTVDPYDQRGDRDTTNKNDIIFTGEAVDGSQKRNSGALTTVQISGTSPSVGASYSIVIDPSKHASSDDSSGGGNQQPSPLAPLPPEGHGQDSPLDTPTPRTSF